jgi:hypothetical protein
VLALARALLGLIGPLRHGCVPFPRSTFAFRASHTRTAGVPPACAHEEVARLALIGDSTGAPVPWSNWFLIWRAARPVRYIGARLARQVPVVLISMGRDQWPMTGRISTRR